MTKAQYAKEHTELVRRVISARHQAKLSQAQAAKRLGISQANLSQIESRRRRIDAIELITIARVYKKPIHFFYE